MIRPILLVAALLLALSSFGQKGETPPYDPAPPSDRLSTYTNQELAFSIAYPKEFVPKTAQDQQKVMERGHRAVYGNDPSGDSEHLQAIRCMRTLFYATSEPTAKSQTPPASDDSFLDSIMVQDVDLSCMPKKPSGEKALSNLLASVLNLPNSRPVVQQMWFVAGGDRRVHSGMSATMITLPRTIAQDDPNSPPQAVPSFTIASAVEQKQHRILIVYLSGNRGERHTTVPHMAIAFDDERPVLLFPFLLGSVNLLKSVGGTVSDFLNVATFSGCDH